MNSIDTNNLIKLHEECDVVVVALKESGHDREYAFMWFIGKDVAFTQKLLTTFLVSPQEIKAELERFLKFVDTWEQITSFEGYVFPGLLRGFKKPSSVKELSID